MDKYRYLVVGGRIKWLPGFEEIDRRYEDRVYVNDYGYHEIGSEEVYTNEKEAGAHNFGLKISQAQFKELVAVRLKWHAQDLKKRRKYSFEIQSINFETLIENQDIKFGDYVILVIRTGDIIETAIDDILGEEHWREIQLGWEVGITKGMVYARAKDKQDFEKKLEELARRLKAIKEES